MSSLNRVVLIGRLGSDPELRYTGSGKAVTSFNIAVDRRTKGETDWITIQAWERTAELCCEHLRKGRQVAVEGRLQVRDFQTQSGEKRKAVEVVADSVQFLGAREDQGEQQHAAPRQQSRQPQPARSTGGSRGGDSYRHPDDDLGMDDIPF